MKKFHCMIYLDKGFGKSGNGYVLMHEDSIDVVNTWNKRKTVLKYTNINMVIFGGYLGIKIIHEENNLKVMKLQVFHQREIKNWALSHNICIENKGLIFFIRKRKCFVSGLVDYFRYYMFA